MNIQLGFDAPSLATLSRLTEFDAWLAAVFFAEAMPQSLDELEQASQAVMLASFINPSGGIETKFRKRVSSPWRGILGNYEPYAQRLNYGFSGKTDALGRTFIAWPASAPDGYHWAEKAVDLAAPVVETIFRTAVQTAIDEVAG